MKANLINKWLDLKQMGSYLATEVFAKERHNLHRIETILWKRYGYDIALKFPFSV